MRRLVLCSWLLAAVGCTALAGGGAEGGGSGLSSGPGLAASQVMPDLVMRPMSGRGEIRLRALKGKVVLLDVWASWCPPCREELPLLDDLARRLRGHGVEVIAVSVDEDRAAAEDMVRLRPRWHLTMAHEPAVADRLKPPTMPSTYLIDARGRLDTVNAGFEPDHIPRIEARLRELAARR
jgi:thiol-disulfide isomerase/thioredoxin